MRGRGQFPVFILNLERDLDRRAEMARQFEFLSGFVPSFIVGVPGGTLPESVCLLLSQDIQWSRKNKGTLGCFLTHVAAWERVSKISEPFAIVLEDDVDVSNLSLLNNLELPNDAEIVFINDRMASSSDEKSITVCPIYKSLLKLHNARYKGSGGDGYLLTGAGARKLLSACHRDFYYGHVDGRLLRYCVSEADLAHLPDGSEVSFIIRNHHNPHITPALGVLKAYSLSPPIVRHTFTESVRHNEDLLSRTET